MLQYLYYKLLMWNKIIAHLRYTIFAFTGLHLYPLIIVKCILGIIHEKILDTLTKSQLTK
jgi:hypothetical protein